MNPTIATVGEPVPFESAARDGIFIGTITRIDPDGGVFILFDGGAAAVPARAIVDLRSDHVGKQAAVSFADADPTQPLILGIVRAMPPQSPARCVLHDETGSVAPARLVLRAGDELTLICGDATITLTKAGKVLIGGRYISTRSAGVNRIRGGSVEIN